MSNEKIIILCLAAACVIQFVWIAFLWTDVQFLKKRVDNVNKFIEDQIQLNFTQNNLHQSILDAIKQIIND
jgi:hypothetical protein